jgi:hypothetical protein
MVNHHSKSFHLQLLRQPFSQSETEHIGFAKILDYEKTSALIAEADRFSIGLCSCRHEKLHIGEKKCDVPLEKCSQFGNAAVFMIRHNPGREVTRSEMEENFAQSKEMGLVLITDNVQKNIRFVCHCCKCCCEVLLGVSKYAFPNVIVTSDFLAEIDGDTCVGYGKCSKACPINAISMNA